MEKKASFQEQAWVVNRKNQEAPLELAFDRAYFYKHEAPPELGVLRRGFSTAYYSLIYIPRLSW